MNKSHSSEDNQGKATNRLNKPAWRALSIIMIIGTIGVFLYSTARNQLIIPISAILFFLLLLLWPAIWDGIVFLFSKRPSSTWGRISMNLVLATLMAVIFEDFYELFVMFARILARIINR